MRDIPVLFSGPMIRAILDGRKTQTRRILKPQPHINENGELLWATSKHRITGYSRMSPDYGKPDPSWARWNVGDRLWVREFHWSWGQWLQEGQRKDGKPAYRFQHQGQRVTYENPQPDGPMAYFSGGVGWGYHSGIHMPRWASRITLEVTEVRVDRLQDISEEDAIAEGLVFDSQGGWTGDATDNAMWRNTPIEAYAALWDRINGPDSWTANPFVTATTFRAGER